MTETRWFALTNFQYIVGIQLRVWFLW